MVDRIHVVPANLREAAGHHEETSEYLRTLPSSHPAIQESLDSLGPIFGELREAGRELLVERRQCYEQQADSQDALAQHRTNSASMSEGHEREARIAVRSCRGGYMHSVTLSEAAMNTDAESLAQASLLTADVSYLKAVMEVRGEIVAAGYTPSAEVPTADDLDVAIERLVAHELHRRDGAAH